MSIARQHLDLFAIHIYSFAEMLKNGMKKNRLIIFLKAHLQQKPVGNYTVLFWVSQQIVIAHRSNIMIVLLQIVKANLMCLTRSLQKNR